MHLKMDLVVLAANAIKNIVLKSVLSGDEEFKSGNYRVIVSTGQVLFRPFAEEEYKHFEPFFSEGRGACSEIFNTAIELARRHAGSTNVIGVQFSLKNELNLKPVFVHDPANNDLAQLLKNDFALNCSTGSIDPNFSVLVEEELDEKLIVIFDGLVMDAFSGVLHYSDTKLVVGTYRCDLKGDITWRFGNDWYKVFEEGNPEGFRNSPVGVSEVPMAGFRVGSAILQVLKSYIDLECNKRVKGIEFSVGKTPEQYYHSLERRQGPMLSAVLMLESNKKEE